MTPTSGAAQVSTSAFQVNDHPVSGPVQLVSINPDGVPSNDWSVFNRIGTTLAESATYDVHDLDTVVLSNTGSTPVIVTGLTLSGQFAFSPALTLPQTIPAGGTLGVPVKFVAVAAPDLHLGSLTITSNDPGRSSFKVTLGGAWQVAPQGQNEPTLNTFMAAFGYQTALVYSGQTFGGNGTVKAVGDEVLSPFWKVADSSKPVSARELVNTHGLFQPAMYYYPRSDTTDPCLTNGTLPGSCTMVMNPPLSEAQTVLPRILDTDGVTYLPGAATFTPTEPFGLSFLAYDFSDNTRNNTSGDVAHGCTGPCGHHVRFYPLKDENGAVVPNTYLVCVEMFGSNYDYQDVVVLLSNITPDLP